MKLSLTLNEEVDWLEAYLDFLFLYLSKRVLLPTELQNITGANLKEPMISSIMQILSLGTTVYPGSRTIERLKVLKQIGARSCQPGWDW